VGSGDACEHGHRESEVGVGSEARAEEEECRKQAGKRANGLKATCPKGGKNGKVNISLAW
jgi:hypothetical protein